MKKYTMTATVEITMELEAENLESAIEQMDDAIYDRLEDLSHSIDSIDED